MFQNVSIEGLVVSSGNLESVHSKAFFGLEKQLTALGLPANKLSSIPIPSVDILKLLTRLDMSSNLISSVHSLPSLPDLEYLDMCRNNITILASGVTQSLPHLKTLLLAENMMDSSSLSHYNFQHLSYLETLDIAQNRLAGHLAPPSLDLFPSNLKTLDLSFNQLEGIRGNTFRHLPALMTLNLQGNLIEEIENFAFLGLVSLSSLDLSHNNILTLAEESLSGLPSLEILSLSHNHLQVVSSMWVVGTPLLMELLVMDNDITNVEEDALTGLHNLHQINLAGNPLSCDCHMSSFHSFLHSTPSLSNSSLFSALCATPIYLTNTPLYQLSLPLDCENIVSQIDTPRSGDYYEYYTETSQEGSGTFLSSSEIHLLHSEYNQSSGLLDLVWRVDEAAIPYSCGQLHVFEESDSEGVVLVTHDTLACDDDKQDKTLLISLDMEKYQLSMTKPYIICISLVQKGSVIPGCSGSISVSNHDQVSIHSLEEQSSITSIHANVSLDHSISVFLHTRVPSTMVHTCKVHVTVGLPVLPPTVLSLRTFNCSVSKYVLADIPVHNYYNVCAVLQVEESRPDQQEVLDLLAHHGQCMIVSTPRVKYHTKSIWPLLLTLIFLAIGIACLTVLYLIVKMYRQDHKQVPFRQASMTDSPLLTTCWRVRSRHGGHDCLADDVDDDHL
jgi:Leucine-rich repeat (LRR) protein